MTRFRVALSIIDSMGNPVGSTDDVIDAADPAAAEAQAIEQWKRVRPSCTFLPLVTTAEQS